MLRGTYGKDGEWNKWNCDISWMWDDHLENCIKHIESRLGKLDNSNGLLSMMIALDAFKEEVTRRKESGVWWAVKDTREWVPPEVRCLTCNDIIKSEFEWHFNTCGCWSVSIDSTVYYTRIIGNPENREKVLTPILDGEFSDIEQYLTHVKQAREARREKKKTKKEIN